MPDGPEPSDASLPDAVIRQRRGISVIWLIPLVAITVAGWLAYRTISAQGPEITIRFATAEGLVAGQTKVRFKDVEVGVVDRVQVSRDLKSVIVTASMVKDVAPYMNSGTRFWVVRPRVELGGVSGLGTLWSGAYVEIDPGEGEATNQFRGLDEPPLVRSDVPGTRYLLEAPDLFDLARGAPIYYRGLVVGQVLGYELAEDARSFRVTIFIEAPHDKLVRVNSRFWVMSAFRVRAGVDGFGVEVGTLQSLITGGVSFDSPDVANAEMAQRDQIFPLYPDLSSVGEAQFTRSVPVTAEFDGSVRGLRAGAPVEMRGMRIGSVRDVRMIFDQETLDIRIPVTLDIQPERIGNESNPNETDEDAYGRLDALVRRGLRAQLETGNLLTGELFVELAFDRPTPGQGLDRSGAFPQIPTIPTELDAIAARLQEVLDRLAALPLEDIAVGLQRSVNAVADVAESEQAQQALEDFAATAANLQAITSQLNEQSAPILADIDRSLETAQATMRQITRTAASTQGLVSDASGMRFDVQALIRELTNAARSIRTFANYLERHPDALLRGKAGGFQ